MMLVLSRDVKRDENLMGLLEIALMSKKKPRISVIIVGIWVLGRVKQKMAQKWYLVGMNYRLKLNRQLDCGVLVVIVIVRSL